MKDELEWIFSGVGISVVTGILGLVWNFRQKGIERINSSFLKYNSIYERNGLRLKCLIPSGIHTLKNDHEIERFFEKIMTIEPHHPLRNWDKEVRNIGYKKFFSHVFKSGKSLGKHNIESYISELKN